MTNGKVLLKKFKAKLERYGISESGKTMMVKAYGKHVCKLEENCSEPDKSCKGCEIACLDSVK